MPNVVSYTPEWLARPSAGFDFLSSQKTGKSNGVSAASGPSRRLAQRGSEVFYAAGTELRWADLSLLETSFNEETSNGKGWRTLKVSVGLPIQRLSISPDGNLLAIVTGHTCHVCILPAASHLRSGDESPMRLRSFQVGPTAHVVEQASIASVIWHPLSIPGLQTLVTVTLDACVRMWELDINNRHSFDQPGLAIDLKKLANATTTASDFSASKFGANRGFSPDDVEMEVAAACFGGQGFDDEYGWASMTLWVAMIEGDIYALCPFLPSRFRLSSSTLPSLSTGVIAEAQILAADQDVSDGERQRAELQSIWLTDLDNQEPILLAGQHEFDLVETFARPERPGAMPKLQGPFQLSVEAASSAITDIFAIAPVVDDAQLYNDEDEQEEGVQGLSIGILCLATASGRVNICLNLDGVEAQWLPPRKSKAITFNDDDDEQPSELLLFQTVQLSSEQTATDTPIFTQSPLDRYEVLVTTSRGVHNLDLKPWVSALEDELAGEGLSGVEFRFKLLLESSSTEVKSIIEAPSLQPLEDVTTAIAVMDANLGYFVLTTTSTGPHAATLDLPYEAGELYEPEMLALPAPEPRESYQAPPEFFSTSQLDKAMESRRANAISKSELAQPVRSKPETLQILTDAHRILSHETNRLGIAAAELFRRCERMCAELADQVSKVNEISQKVTSLTEIEGDGDELDDEDHTIDARIDQRTIKIQSNTSNMNERLETLRRKMLRMGGEDLSNKERAFAGEIWQLRDMIKGSDASAPGDSMSIVRLDLESSTEQDTSDKGTLTIRLHNASEISDDLIAQAEQSMSRPLTGDETRRPAAVTNEYKRQKLDRVMQLLERETALMDAVTKRLSRLGGLA